MLGFNEMRADVASSRRGRYEQSRRVKELINCESQCMTERRINSVEELVGNYDNRALFPTTSRYGHGL